MRVFPGFPRNSRRYAGAWLYRHVVRRSVAWSSRPGNGAQQFVILRCKHRANLVQRVQLRLRASLAGYTAEAVAKAGPVALRGRRFATAPQGDGSKEYGVANTSRRGAALRAHGGTQFGPVHAGGTADIGERLVDAGLHALQAADIDMRVFMLQKNGRTPRRASCACDPAHRSWAGRARGNTHWAQLGAPHRLPHRRRRRRRGRHATPAGCHRTRTRPRAQRLRCSGL